MRTRGLLALLKIQPGEAAMALMVALFFGLIDLGRAMGDSAADALFFRRFGIEYLPYAFMALGLLTFGASLAFAALLGRFQKGRYFSALLMLIAFVLLLERAAIALDLAALYPVLWLSINLAAALLGTILWTTAGEVCDARQAKRLFPIFVSSSILGSLLGSLVIGPVARLLGAENLIALYVVLLAASALLIRALAGRYFRPAPGRRETPFFLADIRVGFDYVRRTPLLQLLAVSAVLFSILYFSVSFPFGRAVSAAFPNEADLAGFLGVFKGISSALMFVAALLIANRLYARIGIVNALLILPVTYLLGFLLFAAAFSLTSAVTVRLAQFVVLSGIGDGAYAAFFNVAPPERRGQVRAFDAGVPSQIGVVLSGILLILGGRTLSTTGIFVMGMAVAAVCVFVVSRMRREYGRALVAVLQAGRLEAFSDGYRIYAGLSNDADAVRMLISHLDDPAPRRQEIAAEMLGRISATSAAPVLVSRLAEARPDVRATFIRTLGQLGAGGADRAVAAFLDDESPAVRAAALEVLPALSGGANAATLDLIRPMLADPDLRVRSQAATSLAAAGDVHAALAALVRLLRASHDERSVAMLLDALEPVLRRVDPPDEDAANQAIAEISRRLQDESAQVRAASCRALGAARSEPAFAALAERLADPVSAVGIAAARSLRASGPAAAPFSLAMLQAAPDPAIVLQALPPGDPAIRVPLRAYAEHELALLSQWRAARRAVPSAGPVTAFLEFVLGARIAQAEQRLIHILGLLGNEQAMQLAGRTLQRGSPDARAAAIEALDTLGDKQLVKMFLPLLEDSEPDGGRETHEANARRTETAICDLIESRDALLRAVAVHAASELGLRDVVQGEAVETLATLSVLERTLMLREVPLFSNLSPDDLVQVAQLAQERWFADGVAMCREGEDGDELFVIAAGQVRVTRGANGHEQLLAIRRTGEIVGEMSIIDSEPRLATVSALGDTRALVITSNMFVAILRDRPEVAMSVMRGLSRRLREC